MSRFFEEFKSRDKVASIDLIFHDFPSVDAWVRKIGPKNLSGSTLSLCSSSKLRFSECFIFSYTRLSLSAKNKPIIEIGVEIEITVEVFFHPNILLLLLKIFVSYF